MQRYSRHRSFRATANVKRSLDHARVLSLDRFRTGQSLSVVQQEPADLCQLVPQRDLFLTSMRPTLVIVICVDHFEDEARESRVQATQAHIKNALFMRVHWHSSPVGFARNLFAMDREN
jgi:hypothetical protein